MQHGEVFAMVFRTFKPAINRTLIMSVFPFAEAWRSTVHPDLFFLFLLIDYNNTSNITTIFTWPPGECCDSMHSSELSFTLHNANLPRARAQQDVLLISVCTSIQQEGRNVSCLFLIVEWWRKWWGSVQQGGHAGVGRIVFVWEEEKVMAEEVANLAKKVNRGRGQATNLLCLASSLCHMSPPNNFVRG